MEINITDKKIQELAEQEVRKEIQRRVQKVLDGDMTYYFREQTIKNLTYQCIYDRIDKEFINNALKNLDKDKMIEGISKEIAKYLYISFG